MERGGGDREDCQEERIRSRWNDYHWTRSGLFTSPTSTYCILWILDTMAADSYPTSPKLSRQHEGKFLVAHLKSSSKSGEGYRVLADWFHYGKQGIHLYGPTTPSIARFSYTILHNLMVCLIQLNWMQTLTPGKHQAALEMAMNHGKQRTNRPNSSSWQSVLKSLMNPTLRPPFQNLSFKFDSPQPRMHTVQGPSHSMFTAHNITVHNGVFNQYIAGEQWREWDNNQLHWASILRIQLEFTDFVSEPIVNEINMSRIIENGARHLSTPLFANGMTSLC